MKKNLSLLILNCSLLFLLTACTPLNQANQTPTPDTDTTDSGTQILEISDEAGELDSVFPAKTSKYSRLRHMDKPDLTDMDNFDEMTNWVDSDWTRDYEITQDDAQRISNYCNEEEVNVYDDYNEWWDLDPIYTLKKNEVKNWKSIKVSWKYRAEPLATLTDSQQKTLSENGRVIAPANTLTYARQIDYDPEFTYLPSDSMSEEWISVYDTIAGDSRENRRYSFNTVLITNDLLLHAYHRLFENSLKYYEETTARDLVTQISESMFDKFLTLAENEDDQELSEIYNFLAAYRSIPTILLPDAESMKVEWEYGIMEDADAEALQGIIQWRANNIAKKLADKYYEPVLATIDDILSASDYQWPDYLILAFSPDYIEDNQILQNYTMYQPRSHYTDSDSLRTYFMAAKWLMREKFYYGDENLVKASLIMASKFEKSELEDFSQLADMIENLVWTDDDLTLLGLMSWAKKNKFTDTESIIKNLTQKDIDDLSDLVHQRIASSQYLVNYNWEVNENEWKSLTDGFVFFGEKFTLDGYLFDLNTAWSTQPEFEYKPNIQTAIMVPDILAWSSIANELTRLRLQKKYEQWLVTEKQFKSYSKVRSESIEKVLVALKDSKVTNNIYHKRLDALGRLLSTVDENAPYFKHSRAYVIKNLVTYLWSYTELKHDTLLYVKQPMMAELWWGGMWDCDLVVEAPALPVPRWYIEADIDLIDELLDLTKDTKKYYEDTPYQNLYDRFEITLEKLKTMSLKQMKNQKISDEDFEWMRNLDGDLYSIVEPIKADYSNPTYKENRGSLIADIFTSEWNNVLYEAIGRPALMYLMVNDANWARVVVWPVFTHYEFYTAEAPINTPSSTRFTDEDWQTSYDEIVKDDLSYWDHQESNAQSLAFQQMLQSLLLHTYATGDYHENVLVDDWE